MRLKKVTREVLANVNSLKASHCFIGGVRAYEITVAGFPPLVYSARSPGKVRVRCWHDYCSYDDRCTFKHFLEISKVRAIATPPGAHCRIQVCGKPATRVLPAHGSANLYMYDDSDVVMSAHDTEIEPMPI